MSSTTRCLWRNAVSAACLTIACLSFSNAALAQSAFYTFTSGASGDGFVWDIDFPPAGLNDLPDNSTFHAPNNTGSTNNIENFSGNVTFFDDNYLAARNSTLISNEAWWGNPTDNFAVVGASFINTDNGAADSMAFDFAWALAGEDAFDSIEIEVFDEEFDSAFLFFNLDNSFNAGTAFGGFDGWEGSIAFDLAEAQNDNPDVDAIVSFSIDLSSIAGFGAMGEFAIDNLSIDGGSGSPGSNVFPSFNSGMNGNDSTFRQNALTDTGVVSITQAVTNDGTEPTTYSTQIVPGGDLTDPGQVSGDPINGGQTVFISPLATFDTNVLSGIYGSDFRFINDSNPSDPDDQLTHQIAVHDPPQLTDDSGTTVQVHSDNEIFLANAAAGPHAGAIRAGVKVANRQISGPFKFSTQTGNLENDEVVAAGDTSTGAIEFDRFGRLNGTYNGSALVDLTMVTSSGNFFWRAGRAVGSLEFAI